MPRSHPRRPSAALLVALAALLLAAVPAGDSLAGVLDKHAIKKIADKEIKKKAKKLTVARARDADALGGVPASGYARSGPVTLTLASQSWMSADLAAYTWFPYATHTQVQTTANGTHVFTFPVDVPVVMAGAAVRVASLRYCYSTTAGTEIVFDQVHHVTMENGVGTEVQPQVYASPHLTDASCRTIALDRVLGAHDQLTLEVHVTWTVSNAVLDLGEVQVTFQPA